jgi:hypothetical protein
MQRHITSHLGNKKRRGFSVGIRWLGGRSLHTTRSIAQIHLLGYYNYWKDLRPLVNKQATNAFWNNSNFKFYEKRNVMRYRTGTNINQKPAYRYRYGFSPNANYPICPCTGSALHILLSGCQHTKMRNMIIKRHNTASVLIVQALQKGPCGANHIAYTDVGSADKLLEQDLDLRKTANKTLPS